MAGRSSLTGERKEKLLNLLREGGRRGASCRAVGISYKAFNDKLRTDVDFAEEVVRAEMEANEVIEDALFNTAVAGNTTAQVFWLTNRDPERWLDRKRQDVTLDGKIDHEHDVRVSLESKLDDLASRLATD